MDLKTFRSSDVSYLLSVKDLYPELTVPAPAAAFIDGQHHFYQAGVARFCCPLGMLLDLDSAHLADRNKHRVVHVLVAHHNTLKLQECPAPHC